MGDVSVIKDLLKDYPKLICEKVFERDAKEIKKILSMEEWKEEKFQNLLTSNIWNSNYEDIKNILSMEEWKEERFQNLLTSTIWCSNYGDIKNILSMEEWKEEKFQNLLTSTIWVSNYEDIIKKIHLKYWNDPTYMHLLTPTIFNITIKNIENNILLFEEYNISRFITTRSLRRNVNEQRLLFNYLIENNINLVIDGKLNPIINCTKKVLKEKYGIDLEKISKGKSK